MVVVKFRFGSTSSSFLLFVSLSLCCGQNAQMSHQWSIVNRNSPYRCDSNRIEFRWYRAIWLSHAMHQKLLLLLLGTTNTHSLPCCTRNSRTTFENESQPNRSIFNGKNQIVWSWKLSQRKNLVDVGELVVLLNKQTEHSAFGVYFWKFYDYFFANEL